MQSNAVQRADEGRAGDAFSKVQGSLAARWPNLRYLSLAFYSAWILLSVTSGEAVSHLDSSASGSLQGELYLSSGVALSVCLLLSGVFHARLQRAIERAPLALLMGLLASVCTFVLMGGFGPQFARAVFVLCGVGTGIGTAFVCLRVGFVTSELNGARAAMMVGSTALVANLLFFMCKALPPVLSLWVISALPFLAAAVSYCSATDGVHGPEADDLIDVESLPKGYFVRLLCVVFVFALAAGIVKGLAALAVPDGMVLGVSQSVLEVFASFIIVALFLVGASIALAFGNVDISKLYIPVCFATAAGMLICPIFGHFVPLQGIVINVLYNVFILMVWCLLIELAGRTTLGPVRVFGFGRGASAVATTVGWAAAYAAQQYVRDEGTAYTVFFLVMAFCLLGAMTLVLNERTLSEALVKTVEIETGVHIVDSGSSGNASAADSSAVDPWTAACRAIADECGFTAREAEVFALLARGRSISYIADELVIAPNTVKGYTKNLYAKADIHSRQELIDLIENRMAIGS